MLVTDDYFCFLFGWLVVGANNIILILCCIGIRLERERCTVIPR